MTFKKGYLEIKWPLRKVILKSRNWKKVILKWSWLKSTYRQRPRPPILLAISPILPFRRSRPSPSANPTGWGTPRPLNRVSDFCFIQIPLDLDTPFNRVARWSDFVLYKSGPTLCTLETQMPVSRDLASACCAQIKFGCVLSLAENRELLLRNSNS